MSPPTATTVSHRLLGPLRRRRLALGVEWDLTPAEAATLAQALIAASRDPARTEPLYLSPQASDDEFAAKVTPTGLVVLAADNEHRVA